jgi:hypothetical protein
VIQDDLAAANAMGLTTAVPTRLSFVAAQEDRRRHYWTSHHQIQPRQGSLDPVDRKPSGPDRPSLAVGARNERAHGSGSGVDRAQRAEGRQKGSSWKLAALAGLGNRPGAAHC